VDQPWYERPFVLALGGTLAIHVLIAIAGDAIVVTHPYVPEKDAPHVELVDVELPEPPPPPPPPPAAIAPAPAPAATTPAPVQKVRSSAPRAPSPPPSETPPPPTPAPAAPGGDEVVKMDNLGPDATGKVPVAVGHPTSDHIGKGGTGGGTGAGSGSGTGEVAPMSVATIKKRAMPHGDYGYIDAGKEYPAEAKQLGIEGPVRVRLVVDDRGKVTSAVLLNHLGHGLDELALRKAREIEFDPARDTDDHVVASVVVWTFNMTLPK
jgi:TonB family protein